MYVFFTKKSTGLCSKMNKADFNSSGDKTNAHDDQPKRQSIYPPWSRPGLPGEGVCSPQHVTAEFHRVSKETPKNVLTKGWGIEKEVWQGAQFGAGE